MNITALLKIKKNRVARNRLALRAIEESMKECRCSIEEFKLERGKNKDEWLEFNRNCIGQAASLKIKSIRSHLRHFYERHENLINNLCQQERSLADLEVQKVDVEMRLKTSIKEEEKLKYMLELEQL